MIVYNKSQRSADYSEIASYYRPGHADYTYDQKYGFRDYRGGGRSSARETIARVAAGAVAVKLLGELGISFLTYTRSIGPVCIDDARFSAEEIDNNPLYMPDATAANEAAAVLEQCMQRQDSCGGTVECIVRGLPVGLGSPTSTSYPLFSDTPSCPSAQSKVLRSVTAWLWHRPSAPTTMTLST